jgi:hypothetical protein
MAMSTKPKPTSTTLADDLLVGARAIAGELGLPVRKVFNLLEGKCLPADKVGAQWVSTRSRLARFFQSDAS